MNESAVQKRIIAAALDRGYEVIRFNSGKAKFPSGVFMACYTWYSNADAKIRHKGVSDLLLAKAVPEGMVAFWVETKRTKGGEAEDSQKDFKKAFDSSLRSHYCSSVEQFNAIADTEETSPWGRINNLTSSSNEYTKI